MTVRYDFDSRCFIATIPLEHFMEVPLSPWEIAMTIEEHISRLITNKGVGQCQ